MNITITLTKEGLKKRALDWFYYDKFPVSEDVLRGKVTASWETNESGEEVLVIREEDE